MGGTTMESMVRYTCRGPRVLPDHIYSRVVQYIADGRYTDAAEQLQHFGLSPQTMTFEDLMVTADTRRGCGVDLTDLILSADQSEMQCPCGKLRITIVRDDIADSRQSMPWWQRLWEQIRSHFR